MTNRLDHTASGMYVISATPFTDSGAVDEESTASLMDFYLKCGVTGMTILGIMGEAPKLSGDESMAFVKSCLSHFRLPIIVGASAAGLDNLVGFSKKVIDAGANALVAGSAVFKAPSYRDGGGAGGRAGEGAAGRRAVARGAPSAERRARRPGPPLCGTRASPLRPCCPRFASPTPLLARPLPSAPPSPPSHQRHQGQQEARGRGGLSARPSYRFPPPILQAAAAAAPVSCHLH
jgi:hypothetical protein